MRGGREPEQVAHPAYDLALDLERGMVAPARVGIDRCGEELGHHAGDVAAALDPADKPRMRVAPVVRQDPRGEVAVDVREGRRLDRQRLRERVADLRRHRPPHGPGGDASHVIDGIVEHRVGLAAKRVPIGRVERHLRIG